MIKYFLNSRLTFSYKIIVFCVMLSLISTYGFAQIPAETPSKEALKIFTLEECNSLLVNYYNENKIEPSDLDILIGGIKNLTASLDKLLLQNKEERDIKVQNELFLLYLEYAEVFSTIYNYGGINHQGKLVKKIDKDIKRFLKFSDLIGEVYIKYADYIYTKLPLPETKRFNTILTLPVLYRMALLKDKGNKTAFVKLSCWHISAADETTSNFNSQIRETEEFIEDLENIDRFNAYIWYSIFYMKIYNTKKGWEYFYKAKSMFPDHGIVSTLYENYQKGNLGL